MFRKFIEGLAFGAGFAVAFLAVGWLGVVAFLPMTFGSRVINAPTEGTSFPSYSDKLEEMPFHELPVEEQIATASVIALVRYEPAADGKMRAVISEIVKKDPAVTFHYSIGDEYGLSSHYPRPGTSYGDGQVVFFTGSPAMMQLAMSYSGDRIRGLGDMPLALLREKAQ
jgi:hypothetical protein